MLTKVLIFLSALFVFGHLQAADPLLEKVRSELSDRIYPASSVIAGYQRPTRNAPTFAVADFRTQSDELFAWSKAVSEILRHRIHFTPGVKLRMPDSSMMYADSQFDDQDGLLVSRASFKTLNESQGINTVLSGRVEKIGEDVLLQTELIDTHSGALITKKIWEFQTKELPLTLINISEWVYESLGVELSVDEMTYLKNARTLNMSAIEAYILLKKEFKELSAPVKLEKLVQLHAQYPTFILFAVDALKYRIDSVNDAEAFRNLEFSENIRSRFPENTGLLYRSVKAIEIFGLPKNVANDQFEILKKLIKDNPHDPNFMLDLGYGLVRNFESPEGISVMLEAVERWPNTYRSWWGLSWAINQYAWQIRGDKFWRDVPDEAQDKFRSLTLLADLCTDKAMALYSGHGRLWVHKLNSLGSRDGFSGELVEVFDKAVKIAPKEEGIYSVAMNYAQDQWGGNSSTRLHIINLAIENNPDAFWPDAMKERYISASDEVIGEFTLQNLLAFFKKLLGEPQTWKIGLLLSIVYAFGKWRGSKQVKVVSDYRDYDEDY